MASFSSALVLFAHPDDAEFMCGATVASWAAEGTEVHYVVATDGSAGSNDTINVCAKITGNSFGAGDPTNTSDALIVASGAGGGPGHTFNLPGYAGSTIADVVGFLGANNPPPAATVFAVRTDAPVTAAAFTGTGTSCPTPP
jgi:dihydroxyacetone kinase